MHAMLDLLCMLSVRRLLLSAIPRLAQDCTQPPVSNHCTAKPSLARPHCNPASHSLNLCALPSSPPVVLKLRISCWAPLQLGLQQSGRCQGGIQQAQQRQARPAAAQACCLMDATATAATAPAAAGLSSPVRQASSVGVQAPHGQLRRLQASGRWRCCC